MNWLEFQRSKVKGQGHCDLTKPFLPRDHIILTSQKIPFKYGANVDSDSGITWLDLGG